ncbi:uncharacterized protein A1O9_08527 [Exophiala aquamarina CBS 119918]|uniref:Uncharacterized protein n=1 Tax=Exophiala aquamarina CBS 119918 TaxID=1182545 RepID=A0A072P7J3_9EURO|nr:uncharacterized protein A1O9_08527 [Exophiala aquamarina CBS 119918]KEF55776.1 hypothetical protein A1O9_08527 [Exophiala aquamarina CBS 119918]
MADYVGSSQTPLQWVNHDAKNMKAAPNRGQVFKHIQSSYRKWKRLEDNKSLAASVKPPGSMQGVVGASDRPPIRGNETHRTALPSRSSSKKNKTTNCSYLPSSCGAVIRRSPSPVTILQRGSSDPFDVLAVEITPQVNSMLSFYRDTILRALCQVDSTTGLGGDIADRTWQSQVESLKDPGHSYALVASASAIASRTAATPHYLNYAAACRLKSIHYLKIKMSEPDSFLNLASMEHVNSACEAEIYAGNMAGARAHMQWLSRLCMRYLEREPLDRMMLVHLANDFYHDVQISMITMQRTSFDVHNWMPKAIAEAVELASRCLPKFMHDVPDTFNAVIDDNLRRSLLDRRKAGKLWLEENNEPVLQPELVYFHALMTGGVHFGRLLDRYLTYKAMAVSPEHPLTQIYLHQHLLLGVLYWMYLCGREVYLGDHLLFDGTGLLLRQLRDSLESADLELKPEERTTEYSETRLYALYTGAFSEQRQRSRRPETTPQSYCWFTDQFARYVSTMGLRTWSEVEAIVETFLYYRILEPRGETWFEKAMSVSLGDQNLK